MVPTVQHVLFGTTLLYHALENERKQAKMDAYWVTAGR
jgi:hypothetical protein